MYIVIAIIIGLLILPANLLALIICYLSIYVFLKYRIDPLHPIYWLIIPWVVAVTPILLGIINYHTPSISLEAMIYVCLAIIVMFLGITLGSLRRHTVKTDHVHRASMIVHSIQARRKFIDKLAMAGMAGSLMFAFEMLSTNSFSFANLFELRHVYETRDVGAFSRIAPLLAWGSWVAFISALIAWRKLPVPTRFFWSISGISTVLVSIFSAGRQSVFQLLLILVICFLLRGSIARSIARRPNGRFLTARNFKIGLLTKSLAAITGALTVAYMAAIAVFRIDNTNQTAKSDYLFTIFGAEPDQATYSFLTNFPSYVMDAFYESIIYFTSVVPLFSGFLSVRTTEIYAGIFTFPWFSRRFGFLLESDVTSAMQERADLMAAGGYMPYGWSTALVGYILDFGYIGALLYLTLFGLFVGFCYGLHRRKQNIYTIVLVISLDVHLFYMIMLPGTSDTALLFVTISTFVLGMRSRSSTDELATKEK